MVKTLSTPKRKSAKKILFIASVIAISGILIYIALPNGESLKNTEQSSVQGIAPSNFHGILPEGTGGDADLNRMKNRWAAPSVISPMTISQIIALPHDVLDYMEKKRRKNWSSEAASQALLYEQKGVQVEGYLARVKEEGPEACNGKSEVYHDFHIWITEAPGQNKNTGIVVEAIPFWKEQFPAWTYNTFDKLAFEHAKVRVTGWLMWDQEHGDEVGKSRGSLWEIHPVTKIEVYTGAGWRELQNRVIP
jgi:hypothetical protein